MSFNSTYKLARILTKNASYWLRIFLLRQCIVHALQLGFAIGMGVPEAGVIGGNITLRHAFAGIVRSISAALQRCRDFRPNDFDLRLRRARTAGQ